MLAVSSSGAFVALCVWLCDAGSCPFFFFNDTATTEIYTLSLHDALPISIIGDESTGALLYHIRKIEPIWDPLPETSFGL